MDNPTFILLCPMLGYKKQNRKYLKINEVKRNIDKIYRNFKSDIILVTGIYTDQYENIKNKKFRICQNQRETTGEIEQIRLGINNSVTNQYIILKEDCVFNTRIIKLGIQKRESFVLIGKNKNNPGMIINEDKIENISFGIEKNFFGDLLFLNSLNKDIIDFIKHQDNSNKTFHELINSFLDKKPIKYYENTNK